MEITHEVPPPILVSLHTGVMEPPLHLTRPNRRFHDLAGALCAVQS